MACYYTCSYIACLLLAVINPAVSPAATMYMLQAVQEEFELHPKNQPHACLLVHHCMQLMPHALP
jgi:hypothetical protein